MQKLRPAILGGIATLAVAGAALATHQDMHVMNVGLPGGMAARIEYEGDVAPKVIVAPAPDFAPVNVLGAVNTAPFVTLDRIAAWVDRDMDAMIDEIGAFQPTLPSSDGKIDLAALGKLAPCSVQYQFASTSNGSSTCRRSVEVTSHGPDEKPQVVSNSSGDCASAKGARAPTRLDDPIERAVPGLTKTGTTAAAEPYHATNII
jgi:hypothetical protein